MDEAWEMVIGLEVHVQLNCRSKAFCGDKNQFGSEPNNHISAISLAHPGTLPRINERQISSAVKLGLAFGSRVNNESYFDRKNYFYPDLPKGYQITQDNQPICVGGHFEFIDADGNISSIRLHHLHMEEDAGKSIHDIDPVLSLLDYNRAGVPLVEIVTEPDLKSADDVFYFITSLQQLVRRLGISDGNMEEGSFRCDCNVSVRKKGDPILGIRCEIKNLNSKKFARQAVIYEANRQVKSLESGVPIIQSTLLYNSDSGTTYPMREKEDANDYRYFNDPDLPPVLVSEEMVNNIKNEMTSIPTEDFLCLKEKHGVNINDARIIIEDISYYKLFENLVEGHFDPGEVASMIVNLIIPNLDKIDTPPITSKDFTQRVLEFLDIITSEKISKSAAYQHLYPSMWQDNMDKPLVELSKQLNILQDDDQSFLMDKIEEVMSQFPDKVNAYQKGKKGLLGFFMGEVMKSSNGSANPKILQQMLKKALDN